MHVRTGLALATLVTTGVAAALVLPQQGSSSGGGRNPVQRTLPVGPGAGAGSGQQGAALGPAQFPLEFRSIDGIGNNGLHREWGAAGQCFKRLAGDDYGDGANTPAGAHRPSARDVSNAVVAQAGSMPNTYGASDFLWMWGQFLDHDITETPVATPSEALDIAVTAGDPWFDPSGSGSVTIPLDRSAYDMVAGVREQVNLITAFVDASNVYGSEDARAHELRTLDGTGRLKTSAGDLLPYNVNGFPNAMSTDASFFLAGDIRANEQVALIAMHTLFVREHNYWADRVYALGGLSDEAIYQTARAIVAAEMQAITYNEFLPLLLGANALPAYTGYDATVDASIVNEFAAAGYRVGHTMLSPTLKRVQRDGSTHPAGDLSLAQAFFNPSELASVGLEPYLRGLAGQKAQSIDPYIIDEVRNFLFGPPGAGGFDLASLNIQRGRDHGLVCYNDVRKAMGLAPAADFAAVSSDAEVVTRLASTYAKVDDVDAWVGLLSEDHAPGALVGPTLQALLAEQFRRLRDGDRFWYQSYLPARYVPWVEQQTLATIIRRNTGIAGELQDDVFRVK